MPGWGTKIQNAMEQLSLWTATKTQQGLKKKKKSKGVKKICHTNTNQKKTRIALFLSDKADINQRKITKNKEEPYIMIKGYVPQNILKSVCLKIYQNRRGKNW